MKKTDSHDKIINLDITPIGIKILPESAEGYEDISTFQGDSFCQAIFKITSGDELLLKPGSIDTCKWSPVVLGFKEAESEFEKSKKECLPPDTARMYMAPLHMFRKGLNPDVVIIRTHTDNFDSIIDVLGWQSFISSESYDQDLTALKFLKTPSHLRSSRWLIRNANKWLDWLNRFDWWQSVSTFAFKSEFISRIFDPFFAKYTANMSMCRNSMAVPLINGKANISFFCPGGIAWGKNSSINMTSGYPYKIYRKLEPRLDYPGKNMGLL